MVEYTNHAADSLFQVESQKYRIRKKIIPEEQEVSLKIIVELNSLLEKVLEKESIENIQIPPIIGSVAKKNSERYSMAILVSPEMNQQHSKFKSITYHLLIFDSVSDRISFYGSSYTRKKMGFVKKFINNMEEIYGLME